MPDMTPCSVPLAPLTDKVEDALLALNNAHAQELSWLDRGRLIWLVEHAFVARRIGNLDGFLLAFDETADYDSQNYLWFGENYRRFVYVDRIVIAPGARRCGLARRLYAELFDRAARAGHGVVGCEVNIRPANPASDRFHAAMAFRPVGQAITEGGRKTVRYMARKLRA
jgi:predicted GNAT superfamily acetyltransferase